MGGVTEHPSEKGTFVAFILRHTTGEYLGYQRHGTLDGALGAINQVQRDWVFEAASECGGSGCSDKGCGGSCHEHSEEAGSTLNRSRINPAKLLIP